MERRPDIAHGSAAAFVSGRVLSPLLWFAVLPLVAALAGCPSDPTIQGGVGTPGGIDPTSGQLLLDATRSESWTYFSFVNGVVAAPTRPEDSADWDIAFQRYNLKTNGGSSGRGQGGAADLGALDLDTLSRATVNEWIPDSEVQDARTGDRRSLNNVLSGWYDYDAVNHQLKSKKRLYAVRSAGGQVGILRIDDYYGPDGVAGKYTIVTRFPVPVDGAGAVGSGGGGGGTGEVTDDVIDERTGLVLGETNLDARGGRTFFAFDQRGAVTAPAQPQQSLDWDFGFDKWVLQTNSGSSGPGQGGAIDSGIEDFDLAKESPADGYTADRVMTIGSEQRTVSTNPELASWYSYDSTTQKIRSQRHVYWLRTAAGHHAKLQILEYYHPPSGEGAFYRLRWAIRTDGGRQFP